MLLSSIKEDIGDNLIGSSSISYYGIPFGCHSYSSRIEKI